MKITCPSCTKPLNVPDEFAGKKVRCSHCGAKLRLPAPRHEEPPHEPEPDEDFNDEDIRRGSGIADEPAVLCTG
jgi:hypothetical protein